MLCENCQAMRNRVNEYATPPGPQLERQASSLVRQVKDLVCNEINCYRFELEVRAFGSVFNRTHCQGSDVDIALTPMSCQCPQESTAPRTEENFVCDIFDLRSYLLPSLVKRYGKDNVSAKNKALHIYGVDFRPAMDIVILMPRCWQYDVCPHCQQPKCSEGYEIRSLENKEQPIATWPKQHRKELEAIDLRTEGRYRAAVRAMKCMLKHSPDRWLNNLDIPPVLVESLFARVTHDCYSGPLECTWCTLLKVVAGVAQSFQSGCASELKELSGMRRLFDDSQTWSLPNVGQTFTTIHQRLENRDAGLLGLQSP